MPLKKAPDGPKNGGERPLVQTGHTRSAKRDPRQGFPSNNRGLWAYEELMSSIDYLYGKLGKLHCLCQKHKEN